MSVGVAAGVAAGVVVEEEGGAEEEQGNCLGCCSIVGGELESWSGAGGSYGETEGTGGTGGTGERWKRTGNRASFGEPQLQQVSLSATLPSAPGFHP